MGLLPISLHSWEVRGGDCDKVVKKIFETVVDSTNNVAISAFIGPSGPTSPAHDRSEVLRAFSRTGAMAIGIKVLPTFRFYKDGKAAHVDQVTGSKMEVLKAAVEKNKAA